MWYIMPYLTYIIYYTYYTFKYIILTVLFQVKYENLTYKILIVEKYFFFL